MPPPRTKRHNDQVQRRQIALASQSTIFIPPLQRLVSPFSTNDLNIKVTLPICECLDLVEHVQEMQTDSPYFL